MTCLPRRRFLGISAATAGLALLPLGGPARADAALVTWQGQALGAICKLQIHHEDRAAAESLAARTVQEVRRLEAMFSLYDANSVLVALNRSGIVVAPPPEFVALLRAAESVSRTTRGAFDVTVQPLWALYQAHFSRPDADPLGPTQAARRAVLQRIGHDKLLVSPDRVAMRRGMAVTLNGIAQGFVTDRIIALLRSEGVDKSLVDMGETRVLGTRPDGRPWQVGIEDPQRPGQSAAVLPVVDRAVATSGPYGFRFDPAGCFNHLFDPATGTCADRYQSVTVIARTATAADALSTAFSLMRPQDMPAVARLHGAELVHLIDQRGAAMQLVV
ncbi:ApbE family lipoprotein [Methylobacterium sp. 4-46]|uniref:FAD:protein FMN transferase n=1 Tax=unclassified Methylobacterium TaxID=2615210 RepID=UPI000152D84F|nr:MULTISPECIES: FAD:protein FMN transferase [Methylobacterium]ACA17279.1 ApbE family lipoprotein [Methylobacterium sp. 4-46]WFT82965.1 FAD:protein FMN transferase [Methylobacterium nodulans]